MIGGFRHAACDTWGVNLCLGGRYRPAPDDNVYGRFSELRAPNQTEVERPARARAWWAYVKGDVFPSSDICFAISTPLHPTTLSFPYIHGPTAKKKAG